MNRILIDSMIPHLRPPLGCPLLWAQVLAFFLAFGASPASAPSARAHDAAESAELPAEPAASPASQESILDEAWSLLPWGPRESDVQIYRGAYSTVIAIQSRRDSLDVRWIGFDSEAGENLHSGAARGGKLSMLTYESLADGSTWTREISVDSRAGDLSAAWPASGGVLEGIDAFYCTVIGGQELDDRLDGPWGPVNARGSSSSPR